MSDTITQETDQWPYLSGDSQAFPVPDKLKNEKVLVLSESLGPINGVTRATQYLLEYLLERGVKVAAVAPEFGKLDELPLRKKLPLVRLPGTPLFYNPDLLFVHPFRMSKIFQRTFRPDVIYLASPASIGLQTWAQLRKAGIPMVANYQTDLSAYAKRMLPPVVNKAVSWGIDQLQGLAFREDCMKTVMVPSSSSRDYLVSIGVPNEKLKSVGRGVDNVLFNPLKRSPELHDHLAPNGELILLCVTRVSLEKGLDFLAEAYQELVREAGRRGLTQRFRLVITGGNTNQVIVHHIQDYFTKRKLEVHFSGPLVGEKLAQMYATGDIFVYTSLTETFGQVIQEAMASGLPVIARREGGPADIVQPGITGYLPAPHDVTDFVNKTLLLIEDAELRAQMGQAANNFALTRSWDAINQQIAQILAEATE